MSNARSPRIVVSMTIGTMYSPIAASLFGMMQPLSCEYSATVQLHRRLRMNPPTLNPRARVEKQVVYPVERDEVWAAITQPAELSRWFGSEVVSLDLRPSFPMVLARPEDPAGPT